MDVVIPKQRDQVLIHLNTLKMLNHLRFNFATQEMHGMAFQSIVGSATA
ncbi:MAG: hypothetical protein SF029_18250 [bacterium]|nr:hypothetical protein [bacterium]